MTRLAGVGIGAAGAHVLAASFADDRKVQRRAAKVAAGHSAIMAGMAAMQLNGTAPPPPLCFLAVPLAIPGYACMWAQVSEAVASGGWHHA